jgi:hypothetical protein
VKAPDSSGLLVYLRPTKQKNCVLLSTQNDVSHIRALQPNQSTEIILALTNKIDDTIIPNVESTLATEILLSLAPWNIMILENKLPQEKQILPVILLNKGIYQSFKSGRIATC